MIYWLIMYVFSFFFFLFSLSLFLSLFLKKRETMVVSKLINGAQNMNPQENTHKKKNVLWYGRSISHDWNDGDNG